MDTSPAPSKASMVASPSPLWRLAERRSRKAGSGNIFSNVDLWQLQRLFKAAGDQDAEQRAQLVWGQGDEAELAQALIGLRARSHRRGLRANGKETLGAHWLQAFNHLRIEESATGSHGKDPAEESDSEAGAQSSPDPHRHNTAGTPGRSSSLLRAERQGPSGASERSTRSSSGLRRREEKNPERYLHRILH